MVATYTTFIASDEQDLIVKLADFLENKVGWYRLDTITDTSTDRDYVWESDGEPDQQGNTNVRIIRIRGTGNEIQPAAYSTYTSSASNTGEILNTLTGVIEVGGSALSVRVIADKERVLVAVDESATIINAPMYVGRFHSFYSAADDPYPNAVKGTRFDSNDWSEGFGGDQWEAIDANGVVRKYEITDIGVMETAGSPNPRNSQFSFFNPTLFANNASAAENELRGKIRGAYQSNPNRLAHNSLVTLASGIHLVQKGTAKVDAFAFGPLVDPRIGDPFVVPPKVAIVDFAYRGFENDANTLAVYNLDKDTGSVFIDGAGSYTMAITGVPTLETTPLDKGPHFSGTNQYASVAGDATSAATFTGDCTIEVVFKVDVEPTTAHALFSYTNGTGETSADNNLGTIYRLTNGAIRVSWEHGSGVDVVSDTATSPASDITRWHYVAVVKKQNGGSYDLEVWHGSFGDFQPVLVETFAGLTNSDGGGSSIMHIARDLADTSLDMDGIIDNVRISNKARSFSELSGSFIRTKL